MCTNLKRSAAGLSLSMVICRINVQHICLLWQLVCWLTPYELRRREENTFYTLFLWLTFSNLDFELVADTPLTCFNFFFFFFVRLCTSFCSECITSKERIGNGNVMQLTDPVHHSAVPETPSATPHYFTVHCVHEPMNRHTIFLLFVIKFIYALECACACVCVWLCVFTFHLWRRMYVGVCAHECNIYFISIFFTCPYRNHCLRACSHETLCN